MKRQIPPLNHLRALEAAIRHESFTKAADELSVTQGAISRHVKALEEYLGFTLVDRVNNNLVIRPESQQFSAALSRAFDLIHKATLDLKKGRHRTLLRVHGYTNFALRWLIPHLPEFQALHPHIEIRVSTGNAEIEFERDDIDLCVRYGLGDWTGVRSELLFRDELLPVCSPALARAHDFREPLDLLKVPAYHSYLRRDEWPRWFALATGETAYPRDPVYLEDHAVVHQCLIAGMGVGLAQRQYIGREVEGGRLQLLFPCALRNDEGFYLVCPREGPPSAAAAIFWDWLLRTARNE